MILSQESPSFLDKEEQVVNVGMNSRQLELCYFRFMAVARVVCIQ